MCSISIPRGYMDSSCHSSSLISGWGSSTFLTDLPLILIFLFRPTSQGPDVQPQLLINQSIFHGLCLRHRV